MRFFRILLCFFKYIYVCIFGRIFYKKEYLTGRWFEDGIFSQGYIWAAEDISYRFHTLKHLGIKWPVSPRIECGSNIVFHVDDLNNFNGFGNYFQTIDAKITIGKGTYIAPNVGIITTNHDPQNLDMHLKGKDVVIGANCWIGMNSVILPGVILGDNTVVGAGSVVTKSFADGHCAIAGAPAGKIKEL